MIRLIIFLAFSGALASMQSQSLLYDCSENLATQIPEVYKILAEKSVDKLFEISGDWINKKHFDTILPAEKEADISYIQKCSNFGMDTVANSIQGVACRLNDLPDDVYYSIRTYQPEQVNDPEIWEHQKWSFDLQETEFIGCQITGGKLYILKIAKNLDYFCTFEEQKEFVPDENQTIDNVDLYINQNNWIVGQLEYINSIFNEMPEYDEGSFGKVKIFYQSPEKTILIKKIEVNNFSFKEVEFLVSTRGLNLVPLYRGCVYDRKNVFLFVDKVNSLDINDELKTKINKKTPKERLNFYISFVETLNELHSLNIIHNDISFGNALFDEKENVFFIDFGNSGAPGEISRGKGTVEYFSPLHANKQKIFEVYDVFSAALMIIVFEGQEGEEIFNSFQRVENEKYDFKNFENFTPEEKSKLYQHVFDHAYNLNLVGQENSNNEYYENTLCLYQVLKSIVVDLNENITSKEFLEQLQKCLDIKKADDMEEHMVKI